MTVTEIVCALVILVGLIGIIVPILPGSILILGAVLAWAVVTGGWTAWMVFAVATLFLVVANVVKYLVPGRQMKNAGVPSSTLWFGALGALVGFFVLPYVGLFVGFVGGIYLAEHRRVGAERAWPSTKHALQAVGVSILIELAGAVLAAITWTIGVLATG